MRSRESMRPSNKPWVATRRLARFWSASSTEQPVQAQLRKVAPERIVSNGLSIGHGSAHARKKKRGRSEGTAVRACGYVRMLTASLRQQKGSEAVASRRGAGARPVVGPRRPGIPDRGASSIYGRTRLAAPRAARGRPPRGRPPRSRRPRRPTTAAPAARRKKPLRYAVDCAL